MTHSTRPPVLIVGGGIGGSALALGLLADGRDVVILEQAPVLHEVGAGIQLAPNALRVLDRLGVLQEVLADAVFPPRATMADAVTGHELASLDLHGEFRDRYGYPYVVTHRADLHDALLAACRRYQRFTLRTGHQVVAFRQSADRVEVECGSGERLTGSALVGADGLHSVVRSKLIGDDLVVHDDVAYRGTVAYDVVPERAGKDDMTWWVGAGLHLMQYPVRSKHLYNQVAAFSRAMPGPGDVDRWGGVDELDRLFAPMHAIVRTAAGQVGRDQKWQMVDRDPHPGWSQGRVTLLGDAAHPMLQNLAQGGCQALEDAAVLTDEVRRAGDDLAAAFTAYETARYQRTATVQTWARRMRNIAHADGLLALLRNELLSRTSVPWSYFDWLYSWDNRS